MPTYAVPSSHRWLLAGVAAYVLGFCFFYPRVLSSADESAYVAQAKTFAEGRFSSLRAIPWPLDSRPMSFYPPGTSLLQTPLVFVGGWRAAAWASVVSLALTVMVLGRWLRHAGRAPVFALVFLAYLPTLVVGRMALSDAPSAAMVAVGLLLFWAGEKTAARSLAAGAVAGLSMAFRETNLLLFLPFLLGAAVRRERRWTWLVSGAAAGVAVRLVLFHFLFGSAFYVPDRGWGWSAGALAGGLPIYAFALLVLLPGGLIAVAIYKGERRAELLSATALFVAVYAFYGYSAQDSGLLTRVVVAGRYMVPLVPLICLAYADAAPRLRVSWTPAIGRAACAATVAAAFFIHPLVHWKTAAPAAMVRDIAADTGSGTAVVVDDQFIKYVSPAYGERPVIDMRTIPVDRLPAVLSGYPVSFAILITRSETAMRLDLSAYGATYLERAQTMCAMDVVRDQQYGDAQRLRIWRIRSCRT